MYLMRKETDASLPMIGEVLGGRDHTTVMYAIQKIASQIETKADLRKARHQCEAATLTVKRRQFEKSRASTK